MTNLLPGDPSEEKEPIPVLPPDPAPAPPPPSPLVPQWLQALVAIVVVFVAGLLASKGLISDEVKTYLGSQDTITAICVALAGLAGLWRTIANRPHGIIKNASALPQVDAVVVKPKTANEVQISNVVPSVEAAGRLPGIRRVSTTVSRH